MQEKLPNSYVSPLCSNMTKFSIQYLIILFIQIFLQYLLNIKKLVIIVDHFFRQVIKV